MATDLDVEALAKTVGLIVSGEILIQFRRGAISKKKIDLIGAALAHAENVLRTSPRTYTEDGVRRIRLTREAYERFRNEELARRERVGELDPKKKNKNNEIDELLMEYIGEKK